MALALVSCNPQVNFQQFPNDPGQNFPGGSNGQTADVNTDLHAGTVVVTTIDASSVQSTSAILQGEAKADNITAITRAGFQYAPLSGTEIPDEDAFQTYAGVMDIASTPGASWSHLVGSLAPATSYVYRAFAYDADNGMTYGKIMSFKTLEASQSSDIAYSGEIASDTALSGEYPAGNNDYWENSSFPNVITISYDGNAAEVSDKSGKAVVSKNGAYVTLDLATNAMEGVEIIARGITDDGNLKIYSAKKFKLTLDGVSINSKTGAAINNQCKKSLYLHLNAGSINALSDAAEYTDVPDTEDSKGCLFSEGQVIVSGAGILSIAGNYKHGLVVDDYILVRKGVTISIEKAASDGIHSNSRVQVDGGFVGIVCESDGIEASDEGLFVTGGKIVADTYDEGFSAVAGDDLTITPQVSISGGTVNITTRGPKGSGIKSDDAINISGGAINVKTSGAGAKGLSSDGNANISGGTINLATSGGVYSEDSDLTAASAIKCDLDLTITGGSLMATASGQGAKGISVDGDILITGGEVRAIAAGSNYGSSSSSGPGGGMGGWGGWPGGGTSTSDNSKSAKGMKADGNISIQGGTVTCESASHEGMESKATIAISGGDVVCIGAEDGMNAGKAVNVSGGRLYAYDNTNDGIDSNGTVSVTGGLVIAHGGGGAEMGVDCDNSSSFSVTGGTVVSFGGSQGGGGAFGGNSSAAYAPGSGQGYIAYSNVSITKDQVIRIADSSDKNILVYKCPVTKSGLYLMISTPNLSGTYTLYKNATATGTDWQGWYGELAASGGSSSGTAKKIKLFHIFRSILTKAS